MPVYAYKGREYEEGSPVVGEEYANSKHLLARSLRGRGIFPVTITEKRIATKFPGFKSKAPGLRAMSQFSRQFAVMLQAGLPLVQCLSVLEQQQESAGFKASLIEVRAAIEGGSTLADALGKHPRVFNQFFVDMIAVGEAGGFLEVAFHRLSVYIQRAAKIKSQALSAAVYPLIVMVVALVTVSLTLVWVVPVFVSLFQGLDAPLPFPTRLVIMISDLTTRCSVPASLLLVLAVLALRHMRRQPAGQLALDRILLGTPFLGGVLRKIAIARFALTLATLLRSGIPLLKGLEITAASSGNRVFRNALEMVKQGVSGGRAVFEPMEESGVFPPLVTRMVAVGEESGELDQMLEHLSVFYEEESQAAVGRLLTALEPTMVVLMGVLVGGIVIAMYLPVFSLVGHFAH